MPSLISPEGSVVRTELITGEPSEALANLLGMLGPRVSEVCKVATL